MARNKAQSVEVVTARLETMSAPSVAALATHPELLDILADALVAVPEPRRAARAFGKRRRAPLSMAEAEAAYDERTMPAYMKDVVNSEEVARLLGLGSRQAVHVRLRQGRLLAVKGARRGLLFPREQFTGGGHVVEGLAELQHLLGVGQSTWAWLDEACDSLGGRRPIELLRDGDIDAVLAAARSASQGDFG